MLSSQIVSKILIDAYPNCGALSKFLIRWRPYICPFHRLVDLVPKSNLMLEVGCGVGLMSVLLAHLGKVVRAVGIDVSQDAINIARRAVIPLNRSVSFLRVEDCEPWPDEDFDTIICIDVLHHVPSERQRDFIKKLARATSCGTLIFKDVSPRPLWKALASILHDILLSGQWIYIRSEDEICQWLEAEGLSVKRYTRLDMLWYSHYLLMAEKNNEHHSCLEESAD